MEAFPNFPEFSSSAPRLRSPEVPQEVLTQMGLRLGMEVSEWPPENMDDLAKQMETDF